MDVEATNMDVRLALGAAFSIRNACETLVCVEQREGAWSLSSCGESRLCFLFRVVKKTEHADTE